ncbi:hypothetical protein AURDEDRAFT_108450 [Auricularia subglabra TFB-10046 SS5]|uniref:Uncharacterized protein n=1 Tax=Auricularia subglabra (strain TFB-10046 / SS5) TaxID=717982 RepID=J0WV01_AURST|nr:hypothetical protein AURDEDRAFT_108450 [Auricularia subglabra TFB-10046 SS5]
MAHLQRQPHAARLPLSAIAPIVRAAAPAALDIPAAYNAAIARLRAAFPDEPRPGTYEGYDASTLRALLALRIPGTARPLTYALLHTPEADQYEDLLEVLLDRFTPRLFTMPAARHMHCTNRIVHQWDEMVLQPALSANGAGLGVPIETLERIKSLPWTDHGLCAPCVDALKEEWTGFQTELWEVLGRLVSEREL